MDHGGSPPYHVNAPFEGRWEDTTEDCVIIGVEISLSEERIQVFVWISSSVIALQFEWFPT